MVVQAGQQTSRTVEFDLEGYIGWGVRGTAVYGYAACRYDNFSTSVHRPELHFSDADADIAAAMPLALT